MIRPRPGWRGCWPYLVPLALFILIAVWLGNTLDYSFSAHTLDNPSGLPPTEVDLGYARYAGNILPNGVRQFLGLRYAAPPIGNLRWRAPEPPLTESGTQSASRFGSVCYPTGAAFPFDGHSEDCLFANVWAPEGANSSSKLPVWVFIHGGGYSSLSSWNWNGSEIVAKEKNVIFVDFHYRVGLFGFLASHKVRNNGDLNAGLLDQRRALEWVQDHIAEVNLSKQVPLSFRSVSNFSQFGGDPNHVVIHGVSAGAGSVAMQLLAYGGRDDALFVGAVADATFFPAQPRLEDAEILFDRVIEQLGCHKDGDPMTCLRNQDTEHLQSANQGLPFPGRQQAPHFYWTPCIDGDFLTDYPYLMFERGDFLRVPVMLGTSTNEGSVFAVDAASVGDFSSFMRDQFYHLNENELGEMLHHYPIMAPLPQHKPWYPSVSRAYGESVFICPSNAVMDAFFDITSISNSSSSSNGEAVPAWAYRFNVVDTDIANLGLGVPHVFDAAAVMGPGMLPTPASYYTYNAPVVPLMSGYYHSFVRSLNPNTHRMNGAPEWGTWGSDETRLVVETGGTTKFEHVDKEQRDRCEFWEGLAEVTEQQTGELQGRAWSA